MSPGSPPVSDQGEFTDVMDASPTTSEEQPAPGSDLSLESPEETPHASENAVESVASQDNEVGNGSNDTAMLSEVRSSLHTISSGVQELATTVQDFLGLSDSESSGSSDYDHDANGRRKFSWVKCKARARRRRWHRRAMPNETRSGQSTSAEDDQMSDDENLKKPRGIKLEIRECNLEQFQSEPAGNRHSLYCVDILIAGDSLDKDIQGFRETVSKIRSGAAKSWKPSPSSSHRTEESTLEDADEQWIRRIRINSLAVREMLRHVCPELGRIVDTPTVFYRPFQVLVSLHKEIAEKVTEIKELASQDSRDRTSVTDFQDRANLTTTNPPEWNELALRLAKDKDALDQLTCFVDFMESRIMPGSRQYRDPSSPLAETIRFEDLWYLLKPGDLVYITRDTAGPNRSPAEYSQRLLRLIQTRLTTTSSRKPPAGLKHDDPWSVIAYFIEHDGTHYAPSKYICHPILPFRGKKKVTDLEIFPASYLKDPQILSQAKSEGSTYVSLIERRSGYYSGWTQTVDPRGFVLKDHYSEGRLASPEHIESEILVDFQETFNAFPDWRPNIFAVPAAVYKFHMMDIFQIDPSELPLLEWDEEGQIRYDRYDQTLFVDKTEVSEGARFLEEHVLERYNTDKSTAPAGEDLALLPTRFFAYAVLKRRFFQLNTRFVRSAKVEANDKAFEKLEINRDYKRLILALVKSHFEKIETEKRTSVEIETQDLIRGKGKGVVILLHGVPGVGKTATAEAVALKWKKPLFPITCGDLGYTAESLEKSLNEIFRLAHHWGCILLLDEADVFITQRERKDLQRNALVSAFLRVLEYYNGIMFLTTNRAGVLDEAVKSRVHLNLHYDHLNEEQTVAIFRQHIQRLRDIEKQRNPNQNEQIKVLHKEILQFARDHFNKHDSNHRSGSNLGKWNGRQIRNAFLIASSLAHYDSEDEGDGEDEDELAEPGRKKQKQLGRSQFELVAQTTLMYDQYRESVYSGKSDDHVAFDREERAMSSQLKPSTPVRMNSPGTKFS